MAEEQGDFGKNTGERAGKIAKGVTKGIKKTAKASAGKAAANLISLKVKLIAFGAFFFILLVFSIVQEVPSSVTNSSMHYNDAEGLSASNNLDYFGDSSEDSGQMSTQAAKIEAVGNSVILNEAKPKAVKSISDAADQNGWTLRNCTDYVSALSREELLLLLSSYSATVDNFVGENSNSYFYQISGVDDMKGKLMSLVAEPSPNYPHGNYIVGADFVRDSNGKVVVTTVYVGNTCILYVDYILYAVDMGSVVQQAFNFKWDDVYDEDAAVNSGTTYRDVINDMQSIVGELLFDDFNGTVYGENGYSYFDSDGNYAGTDFGNSNSSIINTALKEIGNTGRKYQSWWGCSSGTAWCAIFTSWCAQQCGFTDANICPKSASSAQASNSIRNFFKSRGQYHSRKTGYKPKAGDYIFIDWDKDGTIDHVGLVRFSDASRVYTVEGNRSNHVIVDDYSLSYGSIVGYASPSYPAENNATGE